ncbi:Esterase E4 [Eumeta japonica]|uniref:Esterase E4 n=1 Tax=Eumeta variegata TaxID=151549 RepID=A0A4C1SU16_EUMVA|nr:Esterase E4 [Eumeta japonica]
MLSSSSFGGELLNVTEPQKLKPWTGVWDATRPGSACLQYDPFMKIITGLKDQLNYFAGSENCLFVNVYSPKLKAGPTLPVVIFIHGGAFMYGAGHAYDPALLLDKDVVAVTLNYRLGPLVMDSPKNCPSSLNSSYAHNKTNITNTTPTTVGRGAFAAEMKSKRECVCSTRPSATRGQKAIYARTLSCEARSRPSAARGPRPAGTPSDNRYLRR